MRSFILILKMVLFLVSNFGFWELARKKLKINVYFLPSLVIGSQILVLFIAGLLNLLPMATFLIYGAGILLSIYYLYKSKFKAIEKYLNPGYIFLMVSLFLLALAVRGEIFTHYDNFSHWALIVKEMIRTNHFPNFENVVIDFQSYPPGSATYIYFFTRFIGKAESIQMLAQAFMMLTGILPLFIFVKKKKIFGLIYMFILTNFLFVFQISIYDLLVDSLLPLFAVAGILYTYHECLLRVNSLHSKDLALTLLGTIPYTVTLVLIKNSGIFFVAIMLLMIIYIIIKKRSTLKGGLLAISAPFISMILWSKHYAYVFSSSSTSKHAMSLENYNNVLKSKTSGDVWNITKKFILRTVTDQSLWIVFGLFISLAVLTILIKSISFEKYLKLVIISVVLYATYMVGTLFMYLFSMPIGEALTLAGYGRYHKTILMVLIVLSAVFSLHLLSKVKRTSHGYTVVLFMLVSILMVWRLTMSGFVTIFHHGGSASHRNWIEQSVTTYEVENQKSYLIAIPESDAGYTYYLAKYILGSNQITTPVITEDSQTEIFAQYDYIFIKDADNPVIRSWIYENQPGQLDQEVIVIEK